MNGSASQAPDEATIEHLASMVSAEVVHLVGQRVGIDLVDIEMLKRQVDASVGPVFVERMFSPDEVSASRGRIERLATRWAVKEAVAKAIGTGFRSGLHPIDIEVITASNGQISVHVADGAVWPHGASTWKWSVSASHEGNWAIAIAVAAVEGSNQTENEGAHE
jgi:holo-[acyl-carrier protein] synthase